MATGTVGTLPPSTFTCWGVLLRRERQAREKIQKAPAMKQKRPAFDNLERALGRVRWARYEEFITDNEDDGPMDP